MALGRVYSLGAGWVVLPTLRGQTMGWVSVDWRCAALLSSVVELISISMQENMRDQLFIPYR